MILNKNNVDIIKLFRIRQLLNYYYFLPAYLTYGECTAAVVL